MAQEVQIRQATAEELMESHLVASIQEYLQLHLTKNSIFLAERLVAQFPSEDNLHLLATCYHRSGQTYRAYHQLRGSLIRFVRFSPFSKPVRNLFFLHFHNHVNQNNTGLGGESCRYLYAVCCLELGKFTEAEAVLLPNDDNESIPNGAAGVHLLGKVYQLSNRPNAAIEQFRNALGLDPLLWCAFEELCSLSPEVDAQEYLETDAKLKAVPVYGNNDSNAHSPKFSCKVGDGAIQELENNHGAKETPVVGQVEASMDSRRYETPTVAPQAIHPPPMKKGPKENVQYSDSESPIMLSDGKFMCGRKFLDEGTVRKVCNACSLHLEANASNVLMSIISLTIADI